MPDVDAGSRSYSRDKQFGMNEIGYQSLSVHDDNTRGKISSYQFR